MKTKAKKRHDKCALAEENKKTMRPSLILENLLIFL